jgi:hypothetical protein
VAQQYVIGSRTAGRLRQLLADGGDSSGGRPSSGIAARGSTWVKVTGAAVSGWYPGVVSLDQNGSFADNTLAVKVKTVDGSALTSGSRYLCTRTGNDPSDNSPRFRTLAQAAAPVVQNTNTSANPTSTPSVVTGFTLQPGTYRITCIYTMFSATGATTVTGQLWNSTAGAGLGSQLLIDVASGGHQAMTLFAVVTLSVASAVGFRISQSGTASMANFMNLTVEQIG